MLYIEAYTNRNKQTYHTITLGDINNPDHCWFVWFETKYQYHIDIYEKYQLIYCVSPVSKKQKPITIGYTHSLQKAVQFAIEYTNKEKG